MQIIVHGKNTQVPTRLKQHATEKLQKVERYLDRIQTLEVEFTEEHNPRMSDSRFTVEVVATTKRHVLRASASAADPMSAVDAVEDKLEAQVKRLKSKFVRRGSRVGNRLRGRKGAPAELPELLMPETRNGQERPISSESDEEEVQGDPGITKVIRFAVKPMTAEEAILQMKTLGRNFYLFLNAESEQTGVVYRRDDGTYGLIEPE